MCFIGYFCVRRNSIKLLSDLLEIVPRVLEPHELIDRLGIIMEFNEEEFTIKLHNT